MQFLLFTKNKVRKWAFSSKKFFLLLATVTLEELREKELDVLRDVLDGVRADKNNLTINDLYNSWVQLKRGLKDNTFSNYKYMYTKT